MATSPDKGMSRGDFLKFALLAPFGAKAALDNLFTEPNLVETPPIQVYLLDPATMDVEDAASRFVRNEAVQFRDAVTQAAQTVGIYPEVIGISEPVGPFRGTRISKVQILGGVPVDTLSGSPFAPAIADAFIDRKSMAATLVMPGSDANLYPIKNVRFELDNGIPKVAFTGGTGTVLEGEVRDVAKDGVTKKMFSRIAVNGYLVEDDQLLEASKLFGTTVFAPESPMAKAFEKWIRTPWMSLWTPDPKLESQVENPQKRKIFAMGSMQNLLNSGETDVQKSPLAVLEGKQTISLNMDSDVEITNMLAAVEQKLKAASGVSDVKLVLFDGSGSLSGSIDINVTTVDGTGAIPKDEPQQVAELVDMTPVVDPDTGDVVWYDKKKEAQFVSIIKKPGVLYRVVSSTSGAKANEITVRPVTGKELKTVPMVSLAPSKEAIANFKPTTFEAAVVGKIPDAKLQKLLQGKNSEIPNLVKSLEGNKNRHPNTVYLQATNIFGGAPLFGVIGLAADVLGFGEMVVDLPKETMPDAETPVTAKIIYVSLLDEPNKPFPVIAGFSYGIKTGKIEIGSPIILRRDSRLAPDKEHRFGSSNLYRVVFTLGSDRVSLTNGKVPQIPEGPNRQFYQRIGQRLKDYFGVAATEDVKKDLVFESNKGNYSDETYHKLLANLMDKPVKLAELINYYA